MGTISARVPDDLEEELDAYVETENLDRSTAVRKLLTERLAEVRRERALSMLDSGEVTLSRAAEIAETDTWELARLAKEQGISWVDDDGLAADLEEL
ncbi:UPF0175 family protein [Halomicrobium urmianum]|uniref:UPF0175 family protein n=1 Tax=Halomicrobium urmianum TaxID=1586233 RepID=UPI001CDA2A94|nr:UPF0175 family protein [Halomicrobium urmianum]